MNEENVVAGVDIQIQTQISVQIMLKMQGSFWSGKSIRKHLSSGDSVPSWGTILLYFEIFLLFTFTVPSPHLAHVSPRSVFMEFKVCTVLRMSSLQSSQWDQKSSKLKAAVAILSQHSGPLEVISDISWCQLEKKIFSLFIPGNNFSLTPHLNFPSRLKTYLQPSVF